MATIIPWFPLLTPEPELPEPSDNLSMVQAFAQELEDIAHDGRPIGPAQLNDLLDCAQRHVELILGRFGIAFALGHAFGVDDVFKLDILFYTESDLDRVRVLVPELFQMITSEGRCICDTVPGVKHP